MEPHRALPPAPPLPRIFPHHHATAESRRQETGRQTCSYADNDARSTRCAPRQRPHPKCQPGRTVRGGSSPPVTARPSRWHSRRAGAARAAESPRIRRSTPTSAGDTIRPLSAPLRDPHARKGCGQPPKSAGAPTKALPPDSKTLGPGSEQTPTVGRIDSGRRLPALAVDGASSSMNVLPIPLDIPRRYHTSLQQLLSCVCWNFLPTGGIPMPAVLCRIVELSTERPPFIGRVAPSPHQEARLKQFLCAPQIDVRGAKRSFPPWLPGGFVFRIAFVNRLHVCTNNSKMAAISTKQIALRRRNQMTLGGVNGGFRARVPR